MRHVRSPDIRSRLSLPIDVPNAAGVYAWEITNVGTYVGKSVNLRRRLREYPNNLRKLILGLPYRRGNIDGYRRVHREMVGAVQQGQQPVCRIVELCLPAELNERERYWISELGTLNGRLR